MKDFLKNILILAIDLVLVYFSANKVGEFYASFFNLQTGFSSFIISSNLDNFVDGFMPSFIFFLSLLFTAFGGSKKYWWIGILLLPAAVFEVYFDLSHIYFPIVLGLAGWALGFLISKLLPQNTG